MNIKEHIEAGHYPTDEKGRALVLIGDANEPDWNAGRATVLATDGCTGEEIIARFPYARACHWSADGRKSFPMPGRTDRAYTLLPPPPRKVEVKAWKLIVNGKKVGLTDDPELARHWRNGCVSGDELIELSGIHEEPWIK